MCTRKIQEEWLLPGKCLSGSLLMALLKPLLAESSLYLLTVGRTNGREE